MHDVLDESMIGVTLDREPHHGSLPEVFAWLSGERDVHFTALQPHQHHPWHAFLVQLAAIARTRGLQDGFPTDPAAWRAMLLGLTAGKHEPWCLVVDDLSAPALLQPPVPEGTLDNFKTLIPTPDVLDILLTTRNFDLKAQRMVHSAPEHWLFALVTKQTFEGYSGKLNYGVARMNGGQSNRPCISVASGRAWAPRFRRDVKVWLEQRDALISGYAYDPEGLALLWLPPWDGTNALPRTSLDPFFIEICRRIRLTGTGASLAAQMSTSQIARIDATDHAGDTGDIWTPTQKSSKKSGNASLTVPASGFNYKKLSELLFGDEWQSSAARVLRDEDGPSPTVLAQALVRGQGKTEGYHERIIPVPAKARRMLAGVDGARRLGLRSKAMVQRVSDVRTLLKTAILTLFQGVREKKLDLRDAHADLWLDRYETRVDDRFFDQLFDGVDLNDEPARRAWDVCLDDLARLTFQEALDEAPLPSAQRYSLLAAAEGRFYGTRKRVFAELYAYRREGPVDPQADAPTDDLEPAPGA